MRRLWLALVVLIPACAEHPAQPPALVDPMAFDGPDLRLEQSILGRFFGRDFLARGVVVKQGRRLDVFMLTPTGQRLYHVRQQGKQVVVHAAVDPWTGMDPRYLLRDVRWMFFERCRGVAECRKGTEVFIESTDEASGLPRRMDVRSASGNVAIVFEGAFECGEHRVPRRARLTSESVDYSIEALMERCKLLGMEEQ